MRSVPGATGSAIPTGYDLIETRAWDRHTAAMRRIERDHSHYCADCRDNHYSAEGPRLLAALVWPGSREGRIQALEHEQGDDHAHE